MKRKMTVFVLILMLAIIPGIIHAETDIPYDADSWINTEYTKIEQTLVDAGYKVSKQKNSIPGKLRMDCFVKDPKDKIIYVYNDETSLTPAGVSIGFYSEPYTKDVLMKFYTEQLGEPEQSEEGAWTIYTWSEGENIRYGLWCGDFTDIFNLYIYNASIDFYNLLP